jgi:hypothetical protein
MPNTLRITTILLLMLAGCSGGADLKQVRQQRAGDYIVTVLSDTGTLKNGSNSLTLEFRRAADNQLVDVGDVQVPWTMPMPSMGPGTSGT